MVTVKKGKYQCDECSLWYKELHWANKCEAWCKKTSTCNLIITAHAEVGDII